MNFKSIRRLLFQFPMWIGLVLGLLLGALGLSGSVLVYDDALLAMSNPMPHATAQGAPLGAPFTTAALALDRQLLEAPASLASGAAR